MESPMPPGSFSPPQSLWRLALHPIRWRVASLGILVLASTLLEGVGIGLFYPLLEYIQYGETFLARGTSSRLALMFQILGISPSVSAFIGLAFAVILATLILKFCVFVSSARIVNSLMRDLRDRGFRNILNAHIFHFYSSSSAALNQTLESEVEYLGQAFQFMVLLIASGLALLVYAAFLVGLSPRLTLLVAAIAAARYLASGIFIRRMRRLGEEYGMWRTQLKSILTALHQGIDVVKAFGTEPREILRFGHLTARIRANADAISLAQAGNSFCEGLLGEGLLCLLVYLAVSQLRVPAAALLTFLFVISRIIPKITAVNDARIRIAEYLSRISLLPQALAEPMTELPYKPFPGPQTEIPRSQPQTQRLPSQAERSFALPPDPALPVLRWGTLSKPKFEDHIVFDGVSLLYPSGEVPSLEAIHLALHRGETLALVGESGAGKSTLAKLLLRLFDPTSGRILVDGIPLPEIRREDWTRLTSIVSQDTFLFDDTLENNVKYGAPDCTEGEFWLALRRARAEEFVRALPQKENTALGERGIRLSGGQRQRIAIARAFLRNSEILVLDEATSAMDAATEASIQEAISELSQGRTMLVIAHRFATIRRADRTAVLNRGRLEGIGTHEELFRHNRLYRKYHDLQALGAAP